MLADLSKALQKPIVGQIAMQIGVSKNNNKYINQVVIIYFLLLKTKLIGTPLHKSAYCEPRASTNLSR